MTHKEFSSKGGKAGTGDSKRRKVTSAMARKAALARWSKPKPATPREGKGEK